LTANRTVPYPVRDVYNIISDINSYSTFIPYCSVSKVTHSVPSPLYKFDDSQSHSSSDGQTEQTHKPQSHTSLSGQTEQDNKREKLWPSEALLKVSFSPFGSSSSSFALSSSSFSPFSFVNIDEEFISKVYCIPFHVVEAISGPDSTPSDDVIKAFKLDHIAYQDVNDMNGDLVKVLKTRWELEPLSSKERAGTSVRLSIEYELTNPLYDMITKNAAPKLAEWFIKAFEKRISHVMNVDIR